MAETSANVLQHGKNDVPEIVEVLSDSFFEYPAGRFVLGPDTTGYEQKLRMLTHFFVMARILRKEILLGIGELPSLYGAALVSRPTQVVSPPELGALRERVWAELGAPARYRYEAFGAACAQLRVEDPHLHLNMIGVRRRAQGRGLGRKLIERVHELSQNDSDSRGVTLNTEDIGNVSLYQHLGYTLVGHATVSTELETWCFFRPD